MSLYKVETPVPKYTGQFAFFDVPLVFLLK